MTITGKIKYRIEKFNGELHFRPDVDGIEILGSFLESDIQTSPTSCDFWLTKIYAVIRREIDNWEGVANIHSANITPDQTTISNEIDLDVEPLVLPTAVFLQAVSDWREGMRQP